MALVSFLANVTNKIKALYSGGRVYYGDVIDPKTKLPYVSWVYRSTSEIETVEDFIIEVDITDNGFDATRIEGLVDSLDGDGDNTSPTGLNRWDSGAGGTPAFKMYRLSRNLLPAADEQILRRQLRYRCRVYSL